MRLLLPALWLTCTTVLAQPLPGPDQVLHTHGETVLMRDGTEMVLEIFRIEPALPRPTLYAAGPLLPDWQDESPEKAPDSPQTGPVAWWISQGFNVVLANVRGTGSSAGSYEFMGREEQQDHYEVIEWIAGQPWSDTQVAGLGAGYYGTSQWFMAIQNPPSLSCIAPVAAITDPYADWAWRGGVANPGLLRWYEREVREVHAFPSADVAPRFLDFDLQRQLLEHRTADSWWLLRSPLANLAEVQVPVFQSGSWHADDRAWLGTLGRLNLMPRDTHTFVGTAANLLQDETFRLQELLPFYQWCFNGKPASGPALQPALRYHVVNDSRPRASAGWPPANIKYTALALQAPPSGSGTGTLVLDQSAAGETVSAQNMTAPNAPTANSSQVLDSANGSSILGFRSLPLQEALALAGPVLLQVHVSSTAIDTALVVELYEEVLEMRFPGGDLQLPGFLDPQVPSGTALLQASRTELISTGILKASMRTTMNTPGEAAQATRLADAPQLLNPGQVYRLDIAFDPVAWQLRAGSRLVVRLRQTEDAELRPLMRLDTLHQGPRFTSRLWLPLAADANLVFTTEPMDPGLSPGTNSDTGQNGPETTADSAARQQTEDLFNSSNPVILLPQK